MSQPSLAQIIKSVQKYRPSCTPSLIDAVTKELSDPATRGHSVNYTDMHRYLQWRLHVSSGQLDAILLGCFVSVYRDELVEQADEV